MTDGICVTHCVERLHHNKGRLGTDRLREEQSRPGASSSHSSLGINNDDVKQTAAVRTAAVCLGQ